MIGGYIISGLLEGIAAAEREAIPNNALKMHGKPMRRKNSRKDKRGKLRKQIIAMQDVARQCMRNARRGLWSERYLRKLNSLRTFSQKP